jgi:outer membrane protein assembly factor BamE (lipoprotein component of BamABCDE complex)
MGQTGTSQHMDTKPLAVNLGRKAGGILAIALAGVSLSACAYLPPAPERPRDVFNAPVSARGHLVTAEQLQQITPGVTRQADVQELLGSPSQTSTFGDGTWYYISSVTRQRPGRALSVSDSRVVTINFNPDGTVKDVTELGQQDQRSIAMVGRETPSPGNDRTILQALFGNIGRFNPAGVPSQQSPGNMTGSGR